MVFTGDSLQYHVSDPNDFLSGIVRSGSRSLRVGATIVAVARETSLGGW
jgi:hypothetical protein